MMNITQYEVSVHYTTTQLNIFTVLLAIYSVVGSAGNSVILIIYCRQRVRQLHNLQIRLLAAVDLFICTVITPYTIFFEWKIVTSDAACRMIELVRHTLEFFSNSILCLIALERYFAVIKPLSRLSYAQINAGIWSALVFSLGLSAPSFLVFTVRWEFVSDRGIDEDSLGTRNDSDLIRVCGYTDTIIGSTWAVVYQTVLTSMFLMGVLILVSLYLTIYIQLWKRDRQRKGKVGVMVIPSVNVAHNTNVSVAPKPNVNDVDASEQIDMPSTLQRFERVAKDTRQNVSRRMGTTLFVCTVIYITTWVPFFIDVFTAVGQLWFRYLFLMSHVTNPFVYGIINKQIRRQISQLFRLDKLTKIFN